MSAPEPGGKQTLSSPPAGGPARALLVAFGLSGAAALTYEVVWTRALSLVMGSTTYALSTMLATFMGGLAVGAILGGRAADRSQNLLRAFAVCELGIGVAGIASVPLIYQLPAVYLAVYRAFHLWPPVFFAVQVLLCALVMAVPTLLMGATFPIVSRALVRRPEEVGREVGAAYGANTAGAVVGSLLAGFALVPLLGLKLAAAAAGAVNLAVGATLLLLSRRADWRLGAAVAVLAAAGLTWSATTQATPGLVNFYSAHRHLEPVSFEQLEQNNLQVSQPLSEGDWPEGHLRAYRTQKSHLLLQVQGKIEGTAPGDVTNTLLLAYLPVAAHRSAKRMLVVGLGAGVTLEAAREAVPEVELVEIHAGVLEVVRRYGPPGVLDGLRIVRDDARAHLMREGPLYDVISSEPSYPTEAQVANLFTREYYALAAARLAPGGVYAQWLPYHLLTNQDVTMMLKTFATAFPHASVWKVPQGLDLIFLGSQQPFARTEEEIRARVDALNKGRWPLEYTLSRTPAEVAPLAARDDVPLNTDDHPRLEFRMARNLLLGDLSLIELPEERPGPR